MPAKSSKAMGDEDDYENNLYAALDYLDMVQMSHRITHIARDLSGGEKQRVVLARQLAKKPMFFLADEPTGTLDPQTAEKLHQTLINGVKKEGITMVITSHWPEVMNQLADYAIWLDHGEILEEGDPTTVVKNFLDTVPLPEKVENPEIGEPEIVLEDVKKHYYSIERGVIKAVDGVSLTVNNEEIFGIVGLSGAGKTTLTRMLIGLTDPSSGKIEAKLGDEWIDMTKVGPLNRGRIIPYIGLLHQEYSLYPHRTVLGNLTDAISLELPAEFGKIKAIHVLDAVGFDEKYATDLLDKYPDELSGGERHRVALAQVLIKEPKVIILDEPTNHLDMTSKEILENAINSYTGTVFYVSHDRYFINRTASRILELTHTKLINYLGNYDYYEEKKEQLTATFAPEIVKEKEAKTVSDNKLDYLERKAEAARIRKLKNDISKVEEKIKKYEDRLNELDEMLEDPSVSTNSAKLNEISKEQNDISKKLDDLMLQWEELSDQL